MTSTRVTAMTMRAGQAADPCAGCGVRDISVCAALDAEELTQLTDIQATVRHDSGDQVIDEGEPATYLFNVVSGTLKLYKLLADGRRQITGFLWPGDFLGLALNDTYAYGAEAVTDLRLCRFPRKELEKLLVRFPKLERRLLSIASNELAAAQEQMLLLGRKTAKEKLASFLVRLARRARSGDARPGAVNLPMTRADIADFLGLTIETVSRTFTALRGEGILEIGAQGEVVVRAPDRLQRIAEGG